MTIHPIDSPDAARTAVLDGMKFRAEMRGFWTPNLRKADTTTLLLCRPHRVAFIPLRVIPRRSDEEVAGRILRAAAVTLGWRFLIREADQDIAAAQAMIGEMGEYRLTELNEGPFVKATTRGFARLPRRFHSAQYERMLLTIPAIYVVALWARDREGYDDTIMPIGPSAHGLRAFRLTPPEELLATVRRVAKQVPAGGVAGG